MEEKKPYGTRKDGTHYCINAEPNTYGHECGKPATWIGTKANGSQSCFCDRCRDRGYEAKGYIQWRKIDA